MNIKPIVAATDGSEESLRAIEWAAGEAVRAPRRRWLAWVTGKKVPRPGTGCRWSRAPRADHGKGPRAQGQGLTTLPYAGLTQQA